MKELTDEQEFRGNIVVVDDTPANLRLLVEILRNSGYKVRPVPNGRLAIPAIHSSPPDLILLDIMMPEMDGYEVCRHLKSEVDTRDIPVIFISAINEVMDKVKAFNVGGVDYITKPFQVEEVLVRVQTHVAMRSLQKNLQQKNNDLAQTLEQLQSTQNQLIYSEKMVALGQLVAGVAHELNTPLGAIRSSIGNITDFLEQNLNKLPQFFQSLSVRDYDYFIALIEQALRDLTPLSTREERKIRRQIRQELEAVELEHADTLADMLVGLGVRDSAAFFLPFLQQDTGESILNTAYQLASLYRSAKNIGTATDRAAKVVFALRTYARYDSQSEKTEANPIEGIETVLTLYYNQIKQGVEAIKHYENVPKICCYPDELNQVWTNLIQNALQAMDYQGRLTIEVKTQNDTQLAVNITDSGKGIPPEIQDRIFNPFFTTKSAGEGSGLGLDIVQKIIDKHEGEIHFTSQPGETTFTVLLPL
ncbi:MAG: response regulator [Jaaginema sp. PMC 1079.18]|nr:response regulator [Jaaginema sp. PMC 1080.18]MEC4849678.1 response regulator [Jaaginema sp. PMC 1079.18]MEC4866161.1 response regulator [Jaaginema sp. PMC 1078.18]